MKQTRADTSIAIVQAVLLHALLFALMFAGLLWTRSNVAPAAQGEPIDAELVAMSDLSASMQRALRRAPEQRPAPKPAPEPEPPKPLPEPLPEAVPPPTKVLPPPVPEPAPVEQEKVQRDAPSPELSKARREQEEKRRQAEQVELEAKRREAARERQKQQQLDEIRKLREQAARERSLAEQKTRQLADARGAPPAMTGNRGSATDLQSRYVAALQQAILRQWTRPETVALGQRCKITIRQLPGGEVIDAKVSPGCPYDALGRQSVERAVLKASPLPYAGFDTVFSRNLELNFVAEDR